LSYFKTFIIVISIGIITTCESPNNDSPLPQINQKPRAISDKILVYNQKQILIDVIKNDIDPDGDKLTIIAVGSTIYGRASIVDNKIKFEFLDTEISETFSFYYTISDSSLSDNGIVSISYSSMD